MESIGMAETPKRKNLARRAGVTLLCFFAVMLVLSYLSRAVSESLKAQVQIGYAGASALDESVEGTGRWAVGETQLYTTYFSRRISQVYVRPGQRVERGDPLFAFDVSTVAGGQPVSDSKLRAARRALEKAEAALVGADDPVLAQSVVDNARQALAFAEFTHAQYYAVQNGGVVLSTFSGTLVKCDLSVGRACEAGVSGLVLAPEGVAFTMTVTAKEAERIRSGDEVLLFDGGVEEGERLLVSEISPPDAEDMVTVVCAGDGGRERLTGASQDWRIEKQSGRYRCCVPLSALRQSGPDQYYVLLLTEKDTILGTQLIASAQPVRLLARDSRRAAIEGSVGEQDRLITSSTKALKDGDYVALKDA